jgi:hypothetical protein
MINIINQMKKEEEKIIKNKYVSLKNKKILFNFNNGNC